MSKKQISAQKQVVSLSDLSPFMLSCMEEGLAVTITVNGTSMMPFLRSHRDAVVLVKTRADALNVGDVPLYLRDNGQYVLHRIVAVGQDGSYTMLGDNQSAREPGIRPDQILGVAAGFHRGKRLIDCESASYKLYVRMWLGSRLFRYAIRRCQRVFHFIGLRFGKKEGVLEQ